VLDKYWSNRFRRDALLERARASGREVIIGSGFHAATYAAIRVLSGQPRPLVLERDSRVGGTFAMTDRPTFYLNSRNRAGMGGLAGDQGASLNFLPGAPIQAANVSMSEYQTNTDMAFIIRLALAQYADVITDANVSYVYEQGMILSLDRDGIRDRDRIRARRIIDARGLGDPVANAAANNNNVLTFPQFMQRMAGMWPLRGLNRVAVIGGGDSGKVSVESLLGIGPQPNMAAMALDNVERIDWYANALPTNCEIWREDIRGRYAAIGRYLRPDRQGRRRLAVLNRLGYPIALPQGVLVGGRTYDLAVLATGYQQKEIDGIEGSSFIRYSGDGTGGEIVARKHTVLPVWRVGPHANIPFSQRELEDGVGNSRENAVSMFRTGSKTAALAATLPGVLSQSPTQPGFRLDNGTITFTTSVNTNVA
jgi:hypothetical protein